MDNQLNILSSRAGFNTALRHFKSVTSYIPEIEDGENLADLVNESLEEKEIERFQVKTILNALLVDKLGYACKSHNLETSIEDADNIINSVSRWGNIHIVLSYTHPQAGLSIINPKKHISWENLLPLTKDELIVVYAGAAEDVIDRKVIVSAIDDFLKLLYGKKIKPKDSYLILGAGNKRAFPQWKR
jgi:hypothetical protein